MSIFRMTPIRSAACASKPFVIPFALAALLICPLASCAPGQNDSASPLSGNAESGHETAARCDKERETPTVTVSCSPATASSRDFILDSIDAAGAFDVKDASDADYGWPRERTEVVFYDEEAKEAAESIAAEIGYAAARPATENDAPGGGIVILVGAERCTAPECEEGLSEEQRASSSCARILALNGHGNGKVPEGFEQRISDAGFSNVKAGIAIEHGGTSAVLYRLDCSQEIAEEIAELYEVPERAIIKVDDDSWGHAADIILHVRRGSGAF